MKIKWFLVLLVIGSVVVTVTKAQTYRPPSSGFFGFFNNIRPNFGTLFFRRAGSTTSTSHITTLTLGDNLSHFGFSRSTVTETQTQTVTKTLPPVTYTETSVILETHTERLIATMTRKLTATATHLITICKGQTLPSPQLQQSLVDGVVDGLNRLRNNGVRPPLNDFWLLPTMVVREQIPATVTPNVDMRSLPIESSERAYPYE